VSLFRRQIDALGSAQGEARAAGDALHDPALQVSSKAQRFPQVPQLCSSLWRSRQSSKVGCDVSQSVSPAAQPQLPAVQSGALPPPSPPLRSTQVRLQAPQLLMLVWRSTHWDPHSVCPVGQTIAWQAPLLHSWPTVQLLPHAPQSVKVLVVSTQYKKPLRSHLVSPVGHSQLPFWQVKPPPRLSSPPPWQAVAQSPQWASLVLRSTQSLPQSVSPGPHWIAWHLPSTQSWPTAQTVSQLPQLLRSRRVSEHW
jgi:hypothetical protein